MRTLSGVKKGIFLTLGLLVLAAVIIASYLFIKRGRMDDEGLVLTFSEQEIQDKLGEKFPKNEKIYEVIPVVIEEPRVKFLEEQNLVRIALTARVDVPFSKKYQASTVFTGSIRYQREDRTLRLSSLEVEEFRATDLPEKFEEPVGLLINVLAMKYLDDYRIYEVKAEDFGDRAAALFLKRVEFQNQQLEVTLGL